MKFRVLPVTPFQQNCSLVWCERTAKGLLIDPGGEAERLLEAAKREGVELQALLLTHGHLDHVGAAREIADSLAIPILGPQREDAFLLENLPEQSAIFGLPPFAPLQTDRWLEEGEEIEFGQVRLEVLHCPGHTPGHLVFFERQARVAFVGDVLFKGSIGRTDFPRGNYAELLASIREKLWPLGDDVTFVPGHGPISTFGEERRTNPFVRG